MRQRPETAACGQWLSHLKWDKMMIGVTHVHRRRHSSPTPRASLYPRSPDNELGPILQYTHPDLVLVGRHSLIIGTASNENPTQFESASRVAILHVADLQDMPHNSPTDANGPGPL